MKKEDSEQPDPQKRRRRRRLRKEDTPAENMKGKRSLAQRVKTAKKRSASSTRWLERQLNDPYVKRAKEEGYVSRAAYKLLQLHERFDLIQPDMKVADLGAAPGGWVQVAKKMGAAHIVGIDLLPIEPIIGATLLQLDMREEDTPKKIEHALDGKAQLVLSDMAPDTIGHRATDHLRIVALVELAAEFALSVLEPGGHFVTKTFQGGAGAELTGLLKRHFRQVSHAKPEASRDRSPETYLVAKFFKG